jgi:putative endonuclease
MGGLLLYRHSGRRSPRVETATRGEGMEQLFYVYILASRRNGTLYVSVTNDLARRVFEHRTGAIKGFTAKYDVKMLVWYEVHVSIVEAIASEKRIKRWRRAWKLALIEKMNPQWLDLYETLNQ